MNDLLGRFIPGVHDAMPAEYYFAVPAMSASGARLILRSAQHFKSALEKPKESTPVQTFGRAVHVGLLEADVYVDRVACAPSVDKRTASGKSQWAEFVATVGDRIVLSVDDYERAARCIAAVRKHPAAAHLLDGAKTEVSLMWEDGKYRVPCKARCDAMNHGGIIDLKTTSDASPEAFARSAANFLYHVQNAHYLSGAEHVLNETPRFFAFVCVESEEPHGVACYVLESNAILAGQHLMSIALEKYAKALQTGIWSGYPDEVTILQLPAWATKFNA